MARICGHVSGNEMKCMEADGKMSNCIIVNHLSFYPPTSLLHSFVAIDKYHICVAHSLTLLIKIIIIWNKHIEAQKFDRH
ncbi:hypothetical protein KIN20_026262 [Parelaphostrongylus tenuis]|uniref:Uncharacterized protein n=1 Tax=Parelaphostrongylus tenuis TaxID=148309 RepID=A0AAD5MWI2_PARTN|nr:hypothetical protein KIN20_026262 [Parelaphostrongylus tenuis]